MTLIVAPYHRQADGSIEWLTVPEPYTDLAGYEQARHTFWNAAVTAALDLRLVRTLATMDVYAEGADLDRLANEIECLHSHLHLFSDDADYWRVRLDNVRSAIGVAKRLPFGHGGVYIG